MMVDDVVTRGGDTPRRLSAARLASLLLRTAGGAGLLLVFAALLYYAATDLRCARDALSYPFGLDYGEGIIWQQALLIPGPRMYGPIDHLPYIVFHYPPVYHLAVRAVMGFGVDPLAAGRAVSIASTLVILLGIANLIVTGLAGRVGRSAMLMGTVIGAMLPLSFNPLAAWFVLMRVDMLAIALTFVAFVFAVRAAQRPTWLVLAMPLFVLAVYTKQSEIAAPVAALAVLLVATPRSAIFAGLGGGALGLSALALLEWMTAGRFLHHIINYNVNTWSFENFLLQLRSNAPYALLLAVAVAGLVLLWRDRRVARRRANAAAGSERTSVLVPMLTLWLLISAGMLVMTGKTGAAANYFIEAMCICAVPAGILIGHACEAIIRNAERGGTILRVGVVCLVLALSVQMSMRRTVCAMQGHTSALAHIQQGLVREIAAHKRPVLSEDMVLLLRAGREVPIEPAIFRELALTGQWDQQDFVRLIIDHTFAFVIMQSESHYLANNRYTAAMRQAIVRAYPRVETRGAYIVRYPDGS